MAIEASSCRVRWLTYYKSLQIMIFQFAKSYSSPQATAGGPHSHDQHAASIGLS